MVLKGLNNRKVQCEHMELLIFNSSCYGCGMKNDSYLTAFQVDPPDSDDGHQTEDHQNGKLNPASPFFTQKSSVQNEEMEAQKGEVHY